MLKVSVYIVMVILQQKAAPRYNVYVKTMPNHQRVCYSPVMCDV